MKAFKSESLRIQIYECLQTRNPRKSKFVKCDLNFGPSKVRVNLFVLLGTQKIQFLTHQPSLTGSRCKNLEMRTRGARLKKKLAFDIDVPSNRCFQSVEELLDTFFLHKKGLLCSLFFSSFHSIFCTDSTNLLSFAREIFFCCTYSPWPFMEDVRMGCLIPTLLQLV